MIAMFAYDFMQRAFIVGILLAIIVPCIEVIIMLKRLSMIGDTLSHTSLAGVAAGLVMGINPILGGGHYLHRCGLGHRSHPQKNPQIFRNVHRHHHVGRNRADGGIVRVCKQYRQFQQLSFRQHRYHQRF